MASGGRAAGTSTHKAIGTGVPAQWRAATEHSGIGHGGSKLAVMASGARAACSIHVAISTSALKQKRRAPPGSTASATPAAAQHDGEQCEGRPGTMHEATVPARQRSSEPQPSSVAPAKVAASLPRRQAGRGRQAACTS